MSTHNIYFYIEVRNGNVIPQKLSDSVLIRVCAVIRSNRVFSDFNPKTCGYLSEVSV